MKQTRVKYSNKNINEETIAIPRKDNGGLIRMAAKKMGRNF